MELKLGEIIEKLRDYSTPELCDGAGVYRAMDWEIKPWIGEKRKIAGTAVTVDVPAGEGSIVADAIHQMKEGDVLVVAGKGNCKSSYWGDHRSICASMKKAEGIVIDGAFRDYEGCEAVGLPIYARGLTCGTALKSGAGTINQTISCGGVSVSPGDIIVGDQNGVIVIRQEEAEGIMERADKKKKAQAAVIEQMRSTGEIITKIKMNAEQ